MLFVYFLLENFELRKKTVATIVAKKIRETAKSTVTTVKPFGFDALFDMQEENSSGHAHAGVYKETSSQPKGPFYPETYPDETDADLTRVKDGQEALGVQIYVKGTVFDLNGKPLENALIEIWQACQSGKYDHPRDDNPAIQNRLLQYLPKSRRIILKHGVFVVDPKEIFL